MTTPRLFLLVAAALLLAGAPVLADPGGKGKGHGNPHGNQGHGNQGQGGGQGNQSQASFTPYDRTAISAYYGSMIQSGNCPPGLAKKNNGCQPPGQAKKWALGQPLPAGLLSYPLPPQLLMQLHPPSGYRYVQVGTDVLMLAIGTNMVVSALQGIIR